MPKVLLIEDDAAQRCAVRLALERRGYEIVDASSGAEALTRAREFDVEVVLLDLGLADVDGVELCRRLMRWPGRPIIVVSAEADEDRIVDALRAGADDYVVKPFAMDLLVARIEVQQRHAARLEPLRAVAALTAGDVRIDPVGRAVTVAGSHIPLNAQQFDLLVVLARRAGLLVTYDTLLGVLDKRADEATLAGPPFGGEQAARQPGCWAEPTEHRV